MASGASSFKPVELVALGFVHFKIVAIFSEVSVFLIAISSRVGVSREPLAL